MKINRREIILKAAIVVASIIGILLLILGIQSSKFGKIKKYDEKDNSPRQMMSGTIGSSYRRGDNMKIKIESDSVANLGDFTFNISGDRKLIANISLKYKANSDSSWFNADKSIKQELIKKSAILRDATIDTMLGNSIVTANSEKMRSELKKTLNKNLNNGEIEEVYFSQFIIQ